MRWYTIQFIVMVTGDEVPSDETVLAAEKLREDSSNEVRKLT